MRVAHHTERRRLSVEQVRLVGEVVEEREVVLDHDHALRFPQSSEDPCDREAVDDVKVARRLVDEVEVGVGRQDAGERRQLELASRELRHRALGAVRHADLGQHRVRSTPGGAHVVADSVTGLGEAVHVLGLDHRLQLPSGHPLEVRVEGGATVVFQDRLHPAVWS